MRAPWRDLPGRYGPWRTVATRYYRRLHSGLWLRLMAKLQCQADAKVALDRDVHMVDSTNVRSHRHAAGARGCHPGLLAEAAEALGVSCTCDVIAVAIPWHSC